MTSLFDGPAPRVFAVAPGEDFARALAFGLRRRLEGGPPEALARVSLVLNTERARRSVEAAIEATAPGPATWLPRLRTLAEAALSEHPPRPAADPARRRLHLTRLVAALLAADGDLGPPSAAPALAESLGRLLDELHREGVALSVVADAAPPEHAAHWETSRRFLALLSEAWPAILAEDGAEDLERLRREAVEALAERWGRAPPADPVIAAGSTGSVGATRIQLAAVARLPNGAVVLPAFDPAEAAKVWSGIGWEHPWRGHRRLIETLGLAPDAIPWWTEPDAAQAPRRRILAEALRPAPVTDAWRDARAELAAAAPAATAGLTLMEAPDPRREAVAIALALREAVEQDRRAALVTPDRTLARRVAAALARWGVEPDDSGGRPLALTPPATFLKLLAAAAFEPHDPVGLLALLKHPLAAPGGDRAAWLRAVGRFERRLLRRRPELADLPALAVAWREKAEADDVLAPALDALSALAPKEAAPLDALARLHVDLAERLAPALWEKAAGAAAREAVHAFRDAAPVFGPVSPSAYPPLFAAALVGEAREEAFRPDPRVAIWGPLEARIQSADLVILGGLNEGTWPDAAPADPWLSRPMRETVGLPAPERRIGLAAHDVLSAAAAPRAVLTRSLKSGGAPTTPSRWLARLTTLLGGSDEAALAAMRARGARLLAFVDPLERPDGAPAPERRPAPRPPAEARLTRLSATEVETLIRDPYAVYARRILRLKPLDPLGRAVDARDRGVILHAALAAFLRRRIDGDADLEAAFRDAVAQEIAATHAPEALRRLWRARMARLAPRFLEEEAARARLGDPLPPEQPGALGWEGFTLTARADRIDRRGDGTLALYDYKTGAPPTDAQIAHFAKQLPLEAAIAEAGGFERAPAARVSALAHVSLGGGRGGGAETPVDADPSALAAETLAGLKALIARYADPETPFLARARPEHIRYASDYDHLSRFGEWEHGGDGAP